MVSALMVGGWPWARISFVLASAMLPPWRAGQGAVLGETSQPVFLVGLPQAWASAAAAAAALP
jgi:hypothetical protein